MTKNCLVFTEQRCWYDAEADAVRGRKELTALSGLGPRLDCTLVFRAAPQGDGDAELLTPLGDSIVLGASGAGSFAGHWRWASEVGRAMHCTDGVVIYVPGLVGELAGLLALLLRKPLVVVAVGDPRESLGRGVLTGLKGAAIRGALVHAMRIICRRAELVRYVTRDSLQQKYPIGGGGRAIAASDVGEVALDDQFVRGSRAAGPIHLLTVASLDQPYKGISELIASVAALVREGREVQLSVAGTGRLEPKMRAQAQATLPAGSVEFLGHISGQKLAEAYRSADAFVLASWTEGLPRAVVEAMASGLPVVATRVGGVPELVDERWLCAPRSQGSLTSTLRDLLDSRDGWASIGERNREVADRFISASSVAHRDFIEEVLGVVA